LACRFQPQMKMAAIADMMPAIPIKAGTKEFHLAEP
jgi:hypothetical protein